MSAPLSWKRERVKRWLGARTEGLAWHISMSQKSDIEMSLQSLAPKERKREDSWRPKKDLGEEEGETCTKKHGSLLKAAGY